MIGLLIFGKKHYNGKLTKVAAPLDLQVILHRL